MDVDFVDGVGAIVVSCCDGEGGRQEGGDCEDGGCGEG